MMHNDFTTLNDSNDVHAFSSSPVVVFSVTVIEINGYLIGQHNFACSSDYRSSCVSTNQTKSFMGLSGRKVKQRIGKDPRNLSWADGQYPPFSVSLAWLPQ